MDEYESREHGALTVPFLAEPEAVSLLRRRAGSHLASWGVGVAERAELCISELVTNVIVHVGTGTPASLHISPLEGRVLVTVTDPAPRALPLLLGATDSAECGRGLALLDALTLRWGVMLSDESKTVWCEIESSGAVSQEGSVPSRLQRVEEALRLYPSPAPIVRSPKLAAAAVQERAVALISDVLHWLTAHGRDPDEVLDRAQMHFEAEAS